MSEDKVLGMSTELAIAILVVVIVLLIVAALAFVYFTVCDKLYVQVFKRPRPQPQVDRSPRKIDQSTIYGKGLNWFYTNRMEFLNIRLKSFDGTVLAGYFRPSSDRSSRNAVILVHGYNEHPANMAAYAKLIMKKMQCHVLIIHQRAHHMSGGNNCTFGLMESVDLDVWFSFLKQRIGHDCRIYLAGRDMGATTCLLAAQQDGFSENVAGIIADSPFVSLEENILLMGEKRFNMNYQMFIPRLKAITMKKLGFDIKMCDCLKHADRIKVPVLLFVGGDDEETHPDAARRIFDSLRSAKRMIVVDHAGHLESYDKAPALYEREVQRFIEGCVVRLVKMGRM